MTTEDVPIERDDVVDAVAAEGREALERVAEGDDRWATLAHRILQEADSDA